MKPLFFLMLGAAAVATGGYPSGEGALAFVAAANDSPAVGTLALPLSLDDSVVRLVATRSLAGPSSPRAGRVQSVSIPVPESPPPATDAPPRMAETPFPPEARWPDSRGRISLPSAEAAASGAEVMSNPWVVRIARKLLERQTVFECGGSIIGGEGGPVAILNGRNVRPGDSLGEFRVVQIQAQGVVFERGGSFFVIPGGRRATVSVASD